MEEVTYRLGNCERKAATKRQSFLSKLYRMPLVRKIVKRKLYESFNFDNSVSVVSGFHCDSAYLTVGNHTSLADVYIHGLGDVIIGQHVSISLNCQIITGMHDTHDWGLVRLKPIIIEDYACLFRGATILQGVKIGRGAYVGAASVVRTDIPPYSIVVGNPCKVIGFRFTPDEAVQFEEEHFSEDQRIDIQVLKSNYQKYFLKRLRDIKSYYEV